MYVCVYVCSLTRPTKLYVHKSALFHLLYTTTDTFCCFFLFLIHSIQIQIRLTAIKLFLLLLLAFVSIPVVLLFVTFSCIFCATFFVHSILLFEKFNYLSSEQVKSRTRVSTHVCMYTYTYIRRCVRVCMNRWQCRQMMLLMMMMMLVVVVVVVPSHSH